MDVNVVKVLIGNLSSSVRSKPMSFKLRCRPSMTHNAQPVKPGALIIFDKHEFLINIGFKGWLWAGSFSLFAVSQK